MSRGSANYTKQEKKKEAEANYFASCLLMPREMFLSEYDKVEKLNEEERIKVLARIFAVPEWAVVHRISQLKDSIL